MMPVQQPLPTAIKKRYWRSLMQQATEDPRLMPGHIEELRAALREAVHIIEDLEFHHRRHHAD